MRPMVWHMAHGIVSSSGAVDPGYEGKLVVQLANLGREAYKLPVGSKLATITFYRTESESHKDHQKERDRQDIVHYLDEAATKAGFQKVWRTPLGRVWLVTGFLLLTIAVLIVLIATKALTLTEAGVACSMVSILTLVGYEFLKQSQASRQS